MTYALHTPYGAVSFQGNEDSEKWAAEYVKELGRPAVAANTRIRELESELKLYRALCDGYTLEELQRVSLTFKAQIDVLRARPVVPEGMALVPIEPTAEIVDAMYDVMLPPVQLCWEKAMYRAMIAASKEPQK